MLFWVISHYVIIGFRLPEIIMFMLFRTIPTKVYTYSNIEFSNSKAYST